MSYPVTFVGRLGADPELKVSGSTTITKARIVTNGRKREADGSWVDVDTSWWDVTVFGRLAEAVADQCRKGQLVMVSGKVKIRTWEDPNGEKRSRPEVVADQVAIVVRPPAEPKPDYDPWASTGADDEPPF